MREVQGAPYEAGRTHEKKLYKFKNKFGNVRNFTYLCVL